MPETIVETKVCSCGTSFTVTDKDLEFYDKISPIFAWKKYLVASPKTCPDCRAQKRLAFRNEKNLYKRTCDISWESIISMYSPDKPYTVYNSPYYDGDERDGLAYGRDFDFTKPFFSQYADLLNEVPKKAIFNSKGRQSNSLYNNYAGTMKNCYLVFDSMESEDCYYGLKVSFAKDCVDCIYTLYSEQCYACCNCTKCHSLLYSMHCNDCRDGYFLFDCRGCHDCLLCMWLTNAAYHYKNKEYTPEDYQKIKEAYLDKLQHGGHEEIQKEFTDWKLQLPHRHACTLHTEDCVGDNLENAKNCFGCYDSFEIHDCKYSARLLKASDCYDYESRGDNSTFIYNAIAVGSSSYKVLFGICNRGTCNSTMYSIFMHGCSHTFGCAGLKKKEYCILNKQYTKEEYEILVPQIIDHMKETGERGEFFPAGLSLFGYNETAANDYYPLDKSRAKEKWFKRSDYEAPFPQAAKTLQANELPSIEDTTEAILEQAIICVISKKPFKIIKPELDFYRKHNLPLPQIHPDVRHEKRMSLRNPRKLRERKCAKCWVGIKTSYAPERPEIVYCEACYNKEIYG